jgi:hypothetical protein
LEKYIFLYIRMTEIKHVRQNNKETMDASKDENTQLSNEDAQRVIDAVEPLIITIKKKIIKPKLINLYNDQPLQVTLENGCVMNLTFSNPK